MSNFIISIHANSLYYFQLKNDNGVTLLMSEGYTSKSGCFNGIEAVKLYAKDDSKFIRMQSTNNGYYFTLKAANGQILARSERYSNTIKMNATIDFIKQNVSHSAIVDNNSLPVYK